MAFRDVLLRVGSDNFKIAALAESKESVLGAASGMHAAKGCTDASVLLNEIDAVPQVTATQQNVVAQL